MIDTKINLGGVDYPLTIKKPTLLQALNEATPGTRMEFLFRVLNTFEDKDMDIVESMILTKFKHRQDDRTRLIKKEERNRRKQDKIATIKRKAGRFIGTTKVKLERFFNRGSQKISPIFKKGLRKIRN